MRKSILLVLLCIAGLACSTLGEPFKPPRPEPDVEAEAIDKLSVEDSLPASHLMEDVAGNISPDDRKYLDEKCSRCHELDRILWTHRAPRSVWKRVLDEPQHREVRLGPRGKERIYKIFHSRQ